MPESEASNPCLACGLCCSLFRVSFYWAEADDTPGGQVPASLTEQISPLMRAMRGTHPHPQRCVALQGEIGHSVSCGIYPLRPTPCREFSVWLPDGTPDPRCASARARHGLPPIHTENTAAHHTAE